MTALPCHVGSVFPHKKTLARKHRMEIQITSPAYRRASRMNKSHLVLILASTSRSRPHPLRAPKTRNPALPIVAPTWITPERGPTQRQSRRKAQLDMGRGRFFVGRWCMETKQGSDLERPTEREREREAGRLDLPRQHLNLRISSLGVMSICGGCGGDPIPHQ